MEQIMKRGKKRKVRTRMKEMIKAGREVDRKKTKEKGETVLMKL